ncbi:MAG: hypothetical protein IKT33_03605 [Clostridia bacterium]|nr:hypothetical protein [Clostridia bacterium]
MKTVHLTDNTVITHENILNLGKAIALKAVKGSLRYAYGNLDYLHKDIIFDLYHRNTTDIYSDGFDIVQETICFLCNFIGHKLGEMCGDMTIRLACFKAMYAYIRKQIKVNNNEIDNEVLLYVPTPESFDKEPTDYSKARQIIRTVTTTQLEKQILFYFYSGVEVKNIAEFLGISTDIVYKRRRKFRQKYLQYLNLC